MLWAQHPCRCQRRVHADQPPRQQREKQLADYESVDSRNSIRETGADLDRETVVSTLFRSESKGKRDRDQIPQSWTENLLQQRFLVHNRKGREIETRTLCSRWKTEKISTTSLNGKLTWPSEEGEQLSRDCMKLRQKLRRDIGKREIMVSLFMRSIRSSNLIDFSYNKQLAGQIRLRETKSAWMENWNWEIGSSQEDHARDCQEIEELRRICCEEADRARRDLMSCLCIKRGIRRPWVFFLTQMQELQNKVNSLSDVRVFLRSWTREQLWSDPLSQSTPFYSESQNHASLRFWIAAWYRELYVYFRKRFWTSIGSRRTILHNLRQFQEFDTVFSRIETSYYGNYKEKRERERHEKRTIEYDNPFTPCPKWRCYVESYWWNFFSQWYDGLSEITDFGNASGKISWLCEFQSWKVNCTALPKRGWSVWSYRCNSFSQCCGRLAGISDFGIPSGKITWLYGIKKLESQLQEWNMYQNSESSDQYALNQRSWDCKVNSQTCDIAIDCGANRFPWLRHAWCIASALKKHLSTHIHFRKRVSVEEQRDQKSDRFLWGRQIAYIIYWYFRATRAYEAVQGLSDLFTFSLQNDDAQDFDVRWDQALLSASEMPSDVILEGLYKSKVQNSVQLQTVLALFGQETARNNGQHFFFSRSETAERPDILWSVNKLARSVTKWAQACDRRFGKADFLHSSHKRFPTIWSCGKHGTAL